jgi:Domain of unknown function (DUF4304)
MRRHHRPRSGALGRTFWTVFLVAFVWKSAGADPRAEELRMASAAAQIGEILDPSLVELSFVRSGTRWFRYEEESVLVIDVQPARYSPGPYVNLGVYYYKYGTQKEPNIVDCHVDARLTSMVPNPLRGDELLNPTNDIPYDVRRDELQTMIRSYAMPWLQSMARLDTAKAVLAHNPKAAHVAPIARADLQPFQQSPPTK